MLFLLGFVMSNFFFFSVKELFWLLMGEKKQHNCTERMQFAGTVDQSKYNLQCIGQRELQNHWAQSSPIIGPMLFLATLAPLVIAATLFFYTLCLNSLLLHRQYISPAPALSSLDWEKHGINNTTCNTVFIYIFLIYSLYITFPKVFLSFSSHSSFHELVSPTVHSSTDDISLMPNAVALILLPFC